MQPHPHSGPGCRDCWQLRSIAQGHKPDAVLFDDVAPTTETVNADWTTEPTISDEIKARMAADPDQALRLFYEAYAILRRVHNYGDWDSEYYGDAAAFWDRLGEWMFPTETLETP